MSGTESPKKLIPWKLTLGALGVVYGDIGTSPLYAFRECFSGHHAVPLNEMNVLGILSLVFWSLIIIISIKYCTLVLRADNHGEGGILALMALAQPNRDTGNKFRRKFIIYLGIFGAALLYGDGVLTPAISVLSSVEGLKIVTPLFSDYVVFITLAILFMLFYFQKYGTEKIGYVFGPIILLWFFTLACLGSIHISDNAVVLKAFFPYYAYKYFLTYGWGSFLTLGAVFLVVTGGEALYADMGHFGRNPIRIGWFFVALPALLLNYLGQGALLLNNPTAITSPFFLLAPEWALLPLVILSTFATVIASQAVISGAFSITSQAVQLGYLPRLSILHTSDKEAGQIYVDTVNWALMFVTMYLVLEFHSSTNLASAYGIAVSGTMIITTILIAFVTHKLWNWPLWLTIIVTSFFVVVDLSFFSANILKVHDGGWVPLILGIVILTIMTTWRSGRDLLALRLNESLLPLNHFIKGIKENPPIRIPGTAIFMNRNNNKVPQALAHNVKHNKVLHEKNILLMVEIDEIPYRSDSDRIKIDNLQHGFQRMTVSYGFMETPDIPEVLESIKGPDKIVDFTNVTFFLGKETLFATARPGMAIWREKLFAFMSRNSHPATNFFKIPRERVVEIGLQIEL
jgi:KUP system potassium uptake protein